MSCSKYEPLLAGKLFDDLNSDEQHRLDHHLQSCAACREQLAAMQQVLVAIGEPARPDMPQHFWEGYWYRLRDRLAMEPAAAHSHWEKMHAIFSKRWAWTWQLATAAALLVIGIMIGQNFSSKESAVKTVAIRPAPANLPAHTVAMRTAQLLDRSKTLLIGIVNDDFEGASSSDLARQRKVSRTLLQETRALQTNLSNQPDQRMQQLLQQLELVLVQIANLEIEHDLSGVEMLREGIDREGLLLKINIEELSRAAQKETPHKQPNKEIL